MHLVNVLDGSTALTFQKIEEESRKDPIIRSVIKKVQSENGWVDKPTPDESVFFSRREELGAQGAALMLGSRVAIPSALRTEALQVLHAVHQGMTKTKALARSYVWWPGMDKDIEEMVKNCQNCRLNRKMPAESRVHPLNNLLSLGQDYTWITPVRFWESIFW